MTKAILASTMLVGVPILYAAPAMAQSYASAGAGQTVTVPVTFIGVVTAGLGDTISIKQADGSWAPYTGPLPTFPYKDGQTVTITFNATVPSADFLKGDALANAASSDGVYRITLYEGGGVGSVTGSADAISVSGGITAATNPRTGDGTTLSMTLLYDSKSDTYTIAPIAGNTMVASYFSGPGYVYDGTTGELVACSGAACDPAGTGGNLMVLEGNADGTQVAAANVPILDSITGALVGLFTLTFSGTWSIGSPVTQVPEPGMLALFGAAAAVPVLRRRASRNASRRGLGRAQADQGNV